ncbi:MAG: DUF1858 domain-containing protein [Candidatus Cloacimonadota bacterium]|nr:DUF1858 domain-containing protein [Candidatus Cloacimonadota bacterium]
MEIERDIDIEDLIEILPASIDYLMKEGIRCIRCGEPIWGTLEEAAKEKNFSDEKIDIFVKELKSLSNKTDNIKQKIVDVKNLETK